MDPHEIKLENLQTPVNPAPPTMPAAPAQPVSPPMPAAPPAQPVSPPMPAAPAPAAMPTVEVPMAQPVSPAQPPQPTPEQIDKELEKSLADLPGNGGGSVDSKKKYLIFGIVAIAVVVLGFVLYKVFAANNVSTDEPTEIESTNTLSAPTEEPSENMEKLEEVVDDLETIYSPEETEILEEPILEEIPTESANTPDTPAEPTAEESSDGKIERFKN